MAQKLHWEAWPMHRWKSRQMYRQMYWQINSCKIYWFFVFLISPKNWCVCYRKAILKGNVHAVRKNCLRYIYIDHLVATIWCSNVQKRWVASLAATPDKIEFLKDAKPCSLWIHSEIVSTLNFLAKKKLKILQCWIFQFTFWEIYKLF